MAAKISGGDAHVFLLFFGRSTKTSVFTLTDTSRERQNIFKKNNKIELPSLAHASATSTVAKMTVVAQMFHLMFFEPREQVGRERVIQRGSIRGKNTEHKRQWV